jgi:hypothetical protein
MIIEAKSTRLNPEPANGRKHYETSGAEKLSRMPLYFVLFITAVAAYLKTAFPGQALEESDSGAGKGSDESGTGPRNRAEEAPGIDDLLDHTKTDSIEDDEPGSSIGRGPLGQRTISTPMRQHCALRKCRIQAPLSELFFR